MELISDTPRTQPTRRLRRRDGPVEPRPTKKLRTNGPSLLYILNEGELTDDLVQMKKSSNGPMTGRRNIRAPVRN